MAGIKTLLQKLLKPKTPGGVRSVKSEIRQKVLDNPKLKGEAEKDALAEINALANKQIDAMKKAGNAKADAEAKEKFDESGCVKEMKKLYASGCAKNEMYKKLADGYGCSKSKFEKLYASNCG